MQHLIAYTVQETEKGTFWSRIGAAFPTKNKGLVVILDAVPASHDGKCRIVLQPPKPKDEAAKPARSGKQNR